MASYNDLFAALMGPLPRPLAAIVADYGRPTHDEAVAIWVDSGPRLKLTSDWAWDHVDVYCKSPRVLIMTFSSAQRPDLNFQVLLSFASAGLVARGISHYSDYLIKQIVIYATDKLATSVVDWLVREVCAIVGGSAGARPTPRKN